MSKKKVNKLVLLGWDAAEWKVIEPLIAQGKMPTLKKFLEQGTSGKIATLDPPFSPMLWTSIATGKRAYDHGIMGFIEPSPKGDGLRPVLSTSRKVKALWNIFNQEGLRSNVIGWWPSHPVEKINGIMVSNFYQNFKGPIDKPWPMLDGTVHPPEHEEKLKEIRVHADELSTPIMENFIPKIKEILDKYIPIAADEKADPELKKRAESYLTRISGLAKNIATCSSIHSAGTYAIANSEWDFTAIYLDTIDHLCHMGMKFHPPKMHGLDPEAYDYFNQIVTSGYLFHDMLLERILNLVDEDTTVMILSDHGFHPDNLRPRTLPKEPASPALEHSPYGFLAVKGPNIKKGEKIFGASLMDITPTILHMYGLPVGEDMEGNVLHQLFTDEYNDKVDFIPSWENVEGNDARHAATEQDDVWASQEAMQQLIDLGYIEKPSENTAKAVQDATYEAKYYLARNYMNGNKFDEAIEILVELVDKNPDKHRYAIRLANAYLSQRKFNKCKDVLDKLKEQEDYPKFKVSYLEAMLSIYTFKIRKAISIFEELKKQSNSPNLFLQIARANNMRFRYKEAEKDFLQSIELDKSSNLSWHGLGVSYLRRNMYDKAVDAFLSAIEINSEMPQAHFHLGEALYKLELYEPAINALLLALRLNPNLVKAHFWLNEAYTKLGNTEKAKHHQELGKKQSKGTRYIVTGLQRSGTSFVMQLLEEAGVKLLFDNEHPADEFNPAGYYEYQPSLNLAHNKTWLNDVEEETVFKVYAQSLPELPNNYNYKIIWVNRSMDEIVSSFSRKSGKKDKGFDIELADKFSHQVNKAQTWLDASPNAEFIVVEYEDLINSPVDELEEIIAFLHPEKDVNINKENVSRIPNKLRVN